MRLFHKDFKENIKSAIIWTIAASAMGFLCVSIYDSMIASSMDEWNKMMQTMPKAMLDAFQIDKYTFNNMMSYYAMEGYLYVSLLLSTFAALLGVKLINKEESEQTTEFILSKPISRVNYIAQKLTMLVIMIIAANVITDIIIYIGMLIGSKDPIDMQGFFTYMTATYLLSITFGLITFAVACFVKRNKGLAGVAIGIVFLSFFLSILANISDTLTNLKYFTLFEYLKGNDIIKNGISLETWILFITLIIGSIIFSFLVYRKKDIYN